MRSCGTALRKSMLESEVNWRSYSLCQQVSSISCITSRYSLPNTRCQVQNTHTKERKIKTFHSAKIDSFLTKKGEREARGNWQHKHSHTMWPSWRPPNPASLSHINVKKMKFQYWKLQLKRTDTNICIKSISTKDKNWKKKYKNEEPVVSSEDIERILSRHSYQGHYLQFIAQHMNVQQFHSANTTCTSIGKHITGNLRHSPLWIKIMSLID